LPSNIRPTTEPVARNVPGAELVVLALGVAGVALVTWFDLQTSLPLLDEYARRWSIQMLVAGNGFQSVGSSPNLVQLLLSAPLALLKTDPAVWRLTAIPFLAMQGIFVGLIARDLGVNRFWSILAGAVIISSPLDLTLSTGMMTETTFLGLFAGAIWAGLRWIDTGRSRWLCVVLTFLATLQRPQGVGVAAVVVFGLLLFSRHRRNLLRDAPAGVALVLLGVLAFRIPDFLASISPHLAGPALTTGPAAVPAPSLGFAIFVLANFPAILGLTMLPMAAGLWGSSRGESERGYWWILPAAIAGLALAFAAVFTLGPAGRPAFVGNMIGITGFGPPLLGGSKVSPFPAAAFVVVVILAIACYLLILLIRRDLWVLSRLGERGQVLVALSALQLLFIMGHGQLFDRYYLAVILPLVPILAVAAGATETVRLAATWGILLIIGSLAAYVIGIQDYVAWQVARHRAAQIAYAQAPVDQVEAGFEEDAENIWLPADADPTGTLPRHVVADPKFELLFAGPDDPRAGVVYSSLGASGKIVIQRRH
jgi:hypothetical protein